MNTFLKSALTAIVSVALMTGAAAPSHALTKGQKFLLGVAAFGTAAALLVKREAKHDRCRILERQCDFGKTSACFKLSRC